MEQYNKRIRTDAELLLTERGAVYHLNLTPDLLADTIITVGDPDRVQEVSKYFDSISFKVKHPEFITHGGRLGKKNVMVTSTGIGPDNIDIVLNELDALANIDFTTRKPLELIKSLNIIRLGTCGSLQKDIPVDSLVTSSYAIGLDNLLHYYRHEVNAEERYIIDDFLQHTRLSDINPYIAEGSINLRKHFTNGYVDGITITAPGFYGPQGRTVRAEHLYPYLIDALSTFRSRGLTATGFEMETAAMYGLGKIMGHKCLSISTVVGNRIDNTASKNIPAAIEHMIKHSLSVIEQL